MTVCGVEEICGFLALRPEPRFEMFNILAELQPGTQVTTDGTITNGTNFKGSTCRYRKVNYNGMHGWANADYLA